MPNLTSLTGTRDSHSSHSLSAGAIVGIIIAVVAFISGVTFATRMWKKKTKNNLGMPSILHHILKTQPRTIYSQPVPRTT
jgi:hypothetical protein